MYLLNRLVLRSKAVKSSSYILEYGKDHFQTPFFHFETPLYIHFSSLSHNIASSFPSTD